MTTPKKKDRRKRRGKRKPKSKYSMRLGEVTKSPEDAGETQRLIDPNNKAPAPINAEDRSQKIQKNIQAITNIINKIRAIPADNISNETKTDLIKIHALARSIVLRYVAVRDFEEKTKLASINKEMDKNKTPEGKQAGSKVVDANQPGSVTPKSCAPGPKGSVAPKSYAPPKSCIAPKKSTPVEAKGGHAGEFDKEPAVQQQPESKPPGSIQLGHQEVSLN